MGVFKPIGIWRAAGLSDKATSYFRNQTPENEKILLLASEKACSVLFRKMGKEGMALAQDKIVFDRAARQVFNFLKEKGDGTAPEWFSKSLDWAGFASSLISLGVSLTTSPDVWRISMESWSAGKVFTMTSMVSAFMGHMSNYPHLADFRDDMVRVFCREVDACKGAIKANSTGKTVSEVKSAANRSIAAQQTGELATY